MNTSVLRVKWIFKRILMSACKCEVKAPPFAHIHITHTQPKPAPSTPQSPPTQQQQQPPAVLASRRSASGSSGFFHFVSALFTDTVLAKFYLIAFVLRFYTSNFTYIFSYYFFHFSSICIDWLLSLYWLCMYTHRMMKSYVSSHKTPVPIMT